MRAQLPNIAGLRHWCLWQLRNCVFVGEPRRDLRRERFLELLVRKAQDRQVSTQASEIFQLKAEHLHVPAGIERDPIIRKHKLTSLYLAKSGNLDHRYGHKAELARRGQAPVASDNIPVVSNQDWVSKTEGPDTAGDLGNLRIAMRAGVARRRHEPL
jgi:hypothetical protein